MTERDGRRSSKGAGRSGFIGYAEMLAAMRDPMTMRQVREKFGGEETHTKRVLNRMRELGLTWICGWETGGPGLPRPIYQTGTGNEPPRPSLEPPERRNPHSLANRIEMLTQFARIVRALDSEPTDLHTLAATVGSSYGVIRRLVTRLVELRFVYVAEWEPRTTPGGVPTAIYAWGNKRSATRPPLKSEAQAKRESRKRIAMRDAQLQVIRALAGVANQPQITEAA